MEKIVIVANGAAYGSEALFNSLRWPLRYVNRPATSTCVYF